MGHRACNQPNDDTEELPKANSSEKKRIKSCSCLVRNHILNLQAFLSILILTHHRHIARRTREITHGCHRCHSHNRNWDAGKVWGDPSATLKEQKAMRLSTLILKCWTRTRSGHCLLTLLWQLQALARLCGLCEQTFQKFALNHPALGKSGSKTPKAANLALRHMIIWERFCSRRLLPLIWSSVMSMEMESMTMAHWLFARPKS